MNNSDKLRISELKELCQKATKAPWHKQTWCGEYNATWAAIGPEHNQEEYPFGDAELDPESQASKNAEDDATFIAESRTAIPFLIELVERQEKQIAVMREALIWAKEFFHARDEMNAKVHCAPLRLSPITERVIGSLAEVDRLEKENE